MTRAVAVANFSRSGHPRARFEPFAHEEHIAEPRESSRVAEPHACVSTRKYCIEIFNEKAFSFLLTLNSRLIFSPCSELILTRHFA